MVIKTEDNTKNGLITPYIAMEVTRENNMQMTSSNFSHLMFKHL